MKKIKKGEKQKIKTCEKRAMIISTEVQIKSQNASFKREIQIRRENQCAERNYIFRERDFG